MVLKNADLSVGWHVCNKAETAPSLRHSPSCLQGSSGSSLITCPTIKLNTRAAVLDLLVSVCCRACMAHIGKLC